MISVYGPAGASELSSVTFAIIPLPPKNLRKKTRNLDIVVWTSESQGPFQCIRCFPWLNDIVIQTPR